MNTRIVAGLLGYLTLFTAAAMLPALILAAAEGEIGGAAAFLLSIFFELGIIFRGMAVIWLPVFFELGIIFLRPTAAI